KCRQLAQTPGKPTDPNTKGCVDKAVAKYTGGDEPAKGCFAKLEAKNPNDCQSTTDSPTVQALAENCVADLVAVVMTPATSTTPTTTTLGPGCDSEPAVFSGITAQHNATRASAIPPPSPPLDPLCWSNSLSALAQAYADTCSIEPPSNFPPGVDVGVNRDYLGGLDVDSAVHQAEPNWAAEAATYDYAAMSCTLANIDTCGNYTQI